MIQRVLVAIDGSKRAPAVFRAAAEIAGRFEASLYVFRAITIPPEFPAAAAHIPADRLPEFVTREAVLDLERQVTNFTRWVGPEALRFKMQPPVVGYGQPASAILEAGNDLDVNLIVLGSHGYSGLDRILGTTAAKVVNLAHRNVLVVHDPAG